MSLAFTLFLGARAGFAMLRLQISFFRVCCSLFKSFIRLMDTISAQFCKGFVGHVDGGNPFCPIRSESILDEMARENFGRTLPQSGVNVPEHFRPQRRFAERRLKLARRR